ncbi:hypothetical protein [Streptomyces microflavus]|uniref:hypothetical protein n=1 Tax=Streptomyces microflavus TaxID=1919 RepID=UPI0033F97C87
MTSSRNRRTQIWAAVIAAAAVIIAAFITGGFGLLKDGDKQNSDNTNIGSGNDVSGDDQCGVTIGGAGDGDSKLDCSGSSSPEPDRSFSNSSPPSGPGPWPYVVFNTRVEGEDQGLYVRSCPVEKGCVRIGHVMGTSVLHAVCSEKGTGYRAGYAEVPDTWLKIKWPTEKEWQKGDPELQSEPDSLHEGWVFAHFASPRDHNGAIPGCS